MLQLANIVLLEPGLVSEEQEAESNVLIALLAYGPLSQEHLWIILASVVMPDSGHQQKLLLILDFACNVRPEPGRAHVVLEIKNSALTAALEHGPPQSELLWITPVIIVKWDFGLPRKVLSMFQLAYIA